VSYLIMPNTPRHVWCLRYIESCWSFENLSHIFFASIDHWSIKFSSLAKSSRRRRDWIVSRATKSR
jgi:hypothetical protein